MAIESTLHLLQNSVMYFSISHIQNAPPLQDKCGKGLAPDLLLQYVLRTIEFKTQ